jgi:hypothetical protein
MRYDAGGSYLHGRSPLSTSIQDPSLRGEIVRVFGVSNYPCVRDLIVRKKFSEAALLHNYLHGLIALVRAHHLIELINPDGLTLETLFHWYDSLNSTAMEEICKQINLNYKQHQQLATVKAKLILQLSNKRLDFAIHHIRSILKLINSFTAIDFSLNHEEILKHCANSCERYREIAASLANLKKWHPVYCCGLRAIQPDKLVELHELANACLKYLNEIDSHITEAPMATAPCI